MKPGGRNSGLLSIEALQARANERWEPTDESGKPIPAKKVANRITLHECRHTCITWLDDAGVRPVVVSNIAGHSVRLPRDGAAEITQARYTHVLPGDIERALGLFDDYVAEAALHAVG
jgi:integrase